jgi:phytoene/squalene synthetase
MTAGQYRAGRQLGRVYVPVEDMEAFQRGVPGR